MEALRRGYRPPEAGVRLILDDHALSHSPPSPTVRPEIHALAKFRASRKGRIKVNKEVLVILKQVSAELDAAQRHYLAHKQFGEAGESVLKFSPNLISLPGDGSGAALSASASEAAIAGAGDDAEGAAGAGAADGAPSVGHRRWGYFPMLAQLRAESAKAKKPPPRQQQQLNVPAAASVQPGAQADDEEERPKGNWMQLMKQKKQAKEDSIAHMVRVRHAVLVIQRAWRAHLKKRASRALAMMMLRAKVRRAHRAAYVSVLLRRRPGQASGDGAANGDEQVPEDENDVQLTVEEEAELSAALQKVLDEGTLSITDVAELQLTDLMQKLKPEEATSSSSSESEQEEEEDEQERGSGWKTLSKPIAPVKRGLAIRLDVDSPSGGNWQGSLRTPGGSAKTPGGTRLTHRIVSADDDSGSAHSTPRSKSSRHSGNRQRLVSGKSVSIRAPSGDEESPSTPTLGHGAGLDGGFESPRGGRTLSRGKSGGVRVGKGVSVVLATADNAVAVAHGDGGVYIRAKSAARQTHRVASRFSPAAAAAAAAEYDAASASEDGSSRPRTPGSRLHTPPSRTRTPDPGAGRGSSVEASYFAFPGSVVGSAAAAGAQPLPLAPNGSMLSKEMFQELLDSAPLPADVAESIAAAAAEAAAAAAAVAAAEAATASGAEPGTAEWHEKQQQYHREYQEQLQQKYEEEYKRQYQQQQYQEYQQQCEQYQHWCRQNGVEPGSQAATEAAAAGSAGPGHRSNQGSPIPGDSPSQHHSRQGRRDSREAFEHRRSSSPGVGSDSDALPHYARPLPPRSSDTGRRSSTADGAVGYDAQLRRVSQPGAGGSPSRRTTAEGPRGFCSTSAPGAAFSKYERGLGDGLQQDYKVLAPDSVAAGRGPSPGPPRSRKSDWGARRSSDEEGLQSSSEGLGQQQDISTAQADRHVAGDGKGSPTKARKSRTGQGLQDRSRSGELTLQQQQQMRSRTVSNELNPLFEGPGGFSYSSAGTASGLSLAGSSSSSTDCSPAEAAAAVAAAAELHQEQSAAAAAAASGILAAAMQGLVLGPGGVWQQEQQQNKVDSWFERLKALQRTRRQPWDPTTAASPKANMLGLGFSPNSQPGGLSLKPDGQGSDRLPSGKWGKRSSVHNAWLFIDGRGAAALPWQALAAATTAGDGRVSSGGDDAMDAAVLAAAEAFMQPGSHLQQLSVEGKRLLVRIMWLKSAAGVLRGLGRDAGALERRVLQLLKSQTGPVGAELLLRSLADHRQQQQLWKLQQQQQLWQGMQAGRQGGLVPLGVSRSTGALDELLSQQQQGSMAGFNSGLYKQVSVGQGVQGFAGDLLGQNLPLLPAARSRLLGRPAAQGSVQQQQQQLMVLAQQQQALQWQQQQHKQQPGPWPDLLQANQQQQLSQQQLHILQLQLQQRQWQHMSALQQQQLVAEGLPSSGTADGQIPIAQRIRLAERSKHGCSSPTPGANSGQDSDSSQQATNSSTSNSSELDRRDNSEDMYGYAVPSRALGAKGAGALALHGQTVAMLPSAVQSQTGGAFAGHKLRAAQQQQQQQQEWLASSGSPVLAATVEQLLASLPGHGTAEQQQQQQQRQQLHEPLVQQPLRSGNQLTLSGASPKRRVNSAAGLSVGMSQTGAAASRSVASNQVLPSQGQGVASNSGAAAVAAAAGTGSSPDSAAGEPVYLSFVTSNRFQQQLRAPRRKTDGVLLPTRSADLSGQLQQQQGLPAGVVPGQSTSTGWCQRGMGLPVVGAGRVNVAPGIRAGSPDVGRSTSTSPVPMYPQQRRAQQQQQQQQQQHHGHKQPLRTSLVGGLPALMANASEGLRLQPGSLQAFVDQQQQQSMQPMHNQQLDMLINQQRQIQQGCVAGMRPQQIVHRATTGELAILQPGVQRQSAAKAAARSTEDVQWQGERHMLGSSLNGSNVTVSLAQPQLPQLAALRVSAEEKTPAQ